MDWLYPPGWKLSGRYLHECVVHDRNGCILSLYRPKDIRFLIALARRGRLARPLLRHHRGVPHY